MLPFQTKCCQKAESRCSQWAYSCFREKWWPSKLTPHWRRVPGEREVSWKFLALRNWNYIPPQKLTAGYPKLWAWKRWLLQKKKRPCLLSILNFPRWFWGIDLIYNIAIITTILVVNISEHQHQSSRYHICSLLAPLISLDFFLWKKHGILHGTSPKNPPLLEAINRSRKHKPPNRKLPHSQKHIKKQLDWYTWNLANW